eukprot:TRINITY_DN66574_c4_g1_i1.p1 TRINITY_DN66574_c4_g1~~TRINITY_DN66574_c4_g1_i1.p1  ORF type:complete len:253 (-),score=17.38 TRINITY_DN66574_c4_g1_i1:168-896(-)
MLNRAMAKRLLGGVVSKTPKGSATEVTPVGVFNSGVAQEEWRGWELQRMEGLDLLNSEEYNRIIYDVLHQEIRNIEPRYEYGTANPWLRDRSRFFFDGLPMGRYNQYFAFFGSQQETRRFSAAFLALYVQVPELRAQLMYLTERLLRPAHRPKTAYLDSSMYNILAREWFQTLRDIQLPITVTTGITNPDPKATYWLARVLEKEFGKNVNVSGTRLSETGGRNMTYAANFFRQQRNNRLDVH